MDTHVRQLAVLNLLLSAAALIGGIATLAYSGGIVELFLITENTDFGVALAFWALYNLLVAVPMAVGAAGLLGFHEWARKLIIVTSALNILNVPFGSVLGGYGLWVLTIPETEPLFLDRRRVKRAHPRTAETGKEPNRVLNPKPDTHT